VGNCLQVQQKVKLRKRKCKRGEEKRKKRNWLEKREEEKKKKKEKRKKEEEKKKKEEKKKEEEGRFATNNLDIFNQVNYYIKILYSRATLKNMQRTLILLPRLTNELNVLMHLKDLPETHMMTVNSRILLPG
jgi:hypothetical protein